MVEAVQVISFIEKVTLWGQFDNYGSEKGKLATKEVQKYLTVLNY